MWHYSKAVRHRMWLAAGRPFALSRRDDPRNRDRSLVWKGNAGDKLLIGRKAFQRGPRQRRDHGKDRSL